MRSVFLSLLLVGLVPNDAWAASAATSVTIDASGRLWVGSQYGALVSDDSGVTWRLMCEAPIGSSATAYRITRGCVPLAATPNGLFHSNDSGCDWARAGGSLGNNVIGAVATDPTNGANVLAAVNVDGGISRVHISFDGGLTFAPTNAFAPAGTLFTDLAFGADGQHAYAMAMDGWNDHIFSSSDGGRYWTLQSNYPSGPNALLIGPNPTNPSVIYYAVQIEGSAWVVRSPDGGVSFGFVRPDIAIIYAGAFTSDGTLYVATDTGIRKSVDGSNFLPQPIVNEVIVSCLTADGNTLYGCADESIAGFSVGKSTDDGLTWTPLLRLHDNVVGPLVCGSSTQVCNDCYSAWPAFATQLGLPNTQQPTCSDGTPLVCPPPPPPMQPGQTQAAPSPTAGTPTPPAPPNLAPPNPGARGCTAAVGSVDELGFVVGLALLGISLRRRSSRR